MLFEKLGRHARGISHKSVLIVGVVQGQWSMLFSNVHIEFPQANSWDYLKLLLPPDSFEAFLCGSIFNQTVCCLREKQVVLVID